MHLDADRYIDLWLEESCESAIFDWFWSSLRDRFWLSRFCSPYSALWRAISRRYTTSSSADTLRIVPMSELGIERRFRFGCLFCSPSECESSDVPKFETTSFSCSQLGCWRSSPPVSGSSSTILYVKSSGACVEQRAPASHWGSSFRVV